MSPHQTPPSTPHTTCPTDWLWDGLGVTTENHLRGRLPSVSPLCASLLGLRSQRPRTPKPRRGTTPRDRRLVLSRSALTVRRRYGNIHRSSIRLRLSACLRTRLTRDDERGPRTPWSSSGRDPHPSLATHVCIHPRGPRTFHGRLPGTLSTQQPKDCCRVFGGVPEPRYIVGAEPLDQ